MVFPDSGFHLAHAKEGVDPIGVAASNRHCVSKKKEEVKMEFKEPEKSGSLLFYLGVLARQPRGRVEVCTACTLPARSPN